MFLPQFMLEALQRQEMYHSTSLKYWMQVTWKVSELDVKFNSPLLTALLSVEPDALEALIAEAALAFEP